MASLRTWLAELRAPFFTASIVPNLVGAAVAWNHNQGTFHWGYFFLAMIATICVNAGCNMVNDYFDFKSGIDLKAPKTPFSGGSGILPQGLLKPEQVYVAALLFFGLASLIGIYLTVKTGLVILYLGLFGVITAYFYTRRIARTGFGEILVGLDLGPLTVLGAYYVQTRHLAFEPLWASIPTGIMVALILYINEFPDCEADMSAGRRHLVARLGKQKAAIGYAFALSLIYVSVLLGVLFRIQPGLALLMFLTLPIAVKAIQTAQKHYAQVPELIPAQAQTIMIHLFTGVLISLGYVLNRGL